MSMYTYMQTCVCRGSTHFFTTEYRDTLLGTCCSLEIIYTATSHCNCHAIHQCLPSVPYGLNRTCKHTHICSKHGDNFGAPFLEISCPSDLKWGDRTIITRFCLHEIYQFIAFIILQGRKKSVLP